MPTTYHVWLKNVAGSRVAVLDDWVSLTYTRRVNSPGQYTLTINGDDPKVDLFELDGQVEVWRADLANGIDWYRDFEGLHRQEIREYLARGEHRYTSQGRGYLDLLARRIIYAAAGSAGADKTGAAETVAKAFVDEQAGAGAAVARQTTGLTVQADGATGNTVTMKRAYRNLLEVLQEIALVGGGDFDLVGTGGATFEFRWYNGQLGSDRTVGNIGGLAPVIFSLAHGNMAQPRYTLDRLDEVNAVYVGGQGEGATRTVEPRVDAVAMAASTWNRREAFRDARNEDAVGGLQSKGDAYLAEQQARQSLTFDVLQVPACLYGKHYFLGDLVTARFGTVEVDKKVIQVTVNVATGGQRESITVELADV